MIFGLFRDKDLDDFARQLARSLGTSIPPASLVANRKISSKDSVKMTNAMRDVFLKVQKYRRERDLGVLKKARLSKIFQDELVALGYGEDFVKEITLSLAEQLTQS